MSRCNTLREKLPLSIIQETYQCKEKYIYIDDYKIRTKDDRYLNFIENGFKCARCGIKGSFVNLECNSRDGNHFNVYAIDENNQEVLLTKDHIYPRSKGGLNNIKNYQVLCEKCNTQKGDNSPITLVQALREGKATKKSVAKAVREHRPKALIGV